MSIAVVSPAKGVQRPDLEIVVRPLNAAGIGAKPHLFD